MRNLLSIYGLVNGRVPLRGVKLEAPEAGIVLVMLLFGAIQR